MSTLAVTVKVAGVAAAGLTVSAYPNSVFPLHPQRNMKPPNQAATATGTTNGSGQVTLTGLSAVAYQLLVVDARGVNNWFPVAASYVGGSYTAIIRWTTPTNVTKKVSFWGDTPGGSAVQDPWAMREHFHEVPATPPQSQLIQRTPVSAGNVNSILVTGGGDWWIGGVGLTVPSLVGTFVLLHSTDGGATWAGFTDTTIGFPGDSVVGVYVNGATILVQVGGNGMSISTNSGATWTTSTTSTGTSVPVLFGSDYLAAHTNSGTGVPPDFSTNGTAWSSGTIVTGSLDGRTVNTIVLAGDGSFVWVPVNGYGLASTDGQNWNGPASIGAFAGPEQTYGAAAIPGTKTFYVVGPGLAGSTGLVECTVSTLGAISGVIQLNNTTWAPTCIDKVAVNAANSRLLIGTDQVAAASAAGASVGYCTTASPSTPTLLNATSLKTCTALAVDDTRGLWLFGGVPFSGLSPFNIFSAV